MPDLADHIDFGNHNVLFFTFFLFLFLGLGSGCTIGVLRYFDLRELLTLLDYFKWLGPFGLFGSMLPH